MEKAKKEEKVSMDDPAEIAAVMFREFGPRYVSALRGLSKKQLMKLCIAIPMFPLEFENILGNDKVLQNTYGYGDRLVQAKMLMINAILQDEMEQKEKAKQAALETEKGETNE